MAKVTNPLLSISASGRVGGVVFRNTGGNHTARALPSGSASVPTQPQLDVRNNCRSAAQAWAAMDQAQKDQWAARGLKLRFSSDRENLTTLNNGWALFLQEWNLQQASAQRLPMLPI